MKAIIISGMPAVGKTTVARLLAQELKIRVMGGGEVLKEIAREHGYNPEGDDWWDTEAGMNFLKERAKNVSFDTEVDRMLEARVGYGNVVITSYPLAWTTRAPAFKVWLDASVERRAERMAQRDNMELKKCIKIVKQRGKENENLYNRLYHIKVGRDKKPFNLIVDANNMDPKQIVMLIIEKLKESEL